MKLLPLGSLVLVTASLATLVACDDSSSPDGAGGVDSGGTSGVERGPERLTVDGDPNGLFWADDEQTLYLADDNGNRILSWTDADGFGLVSDLPSAAPQGAGLGQLVRLEDGTFVVTRFGYGTAGDVVFVPPAGPPEVVPDLDVERRRIGLTVTNEGVLYDSWFVRLSTGDRVGAVGLLSLDGVETEVIDGLVKPVGVLAIGEELFVSDQDLGQILRAPLDDLASYTVFAEVEGPDLLAEGPEGSVLVGSTTGSVYQVAATGNVSVLSSGYQQVRGVAYDPTNERVFIVDHDPDETDGTLHAVHIVPVD